VAGWKVILRLGPRIVKERAGDLPGAIAELRISLVAMAAEVTNEPTSGVFRDYEPIEVVIARGELRGPGGVRAGIDVRGDASAEAWTGRISKHVVEQQPGEDAYQALERVLSGK
jgi:hypothetical protein